MDKILANAVTASVVPGQAATDAKRKLDQIRDLPQNSTVPLSEEDSQGAKMLEAFSVDISHQEVERIIIELEEIYKTQPGEWLPIYGIGSILANDLGYEDEDEFEDALKSTWPFWKLLPRWTPYCRVAKEPASPNPPMLCPSSVRRVLMLMTPDIASLPQSAL